MGHLVVKGEHLDVTLNDLPTLGTHAHHLEPRLVDLLCKVVYCNIRRGCHQHLALIHLGKVVNNARRCDSLAGARRSLDHRQRLQEGVAASCAG